MLLENSFDDHPMKSVSFAISPFDQSTTLNFMSYALLSLVTVLLSYYFLDLLKRIPMKSNNINLFSSSFIQCALISIPSVILSSLSFQCGENTNPQIAQTNGYFILLVTAFSITLLAVFLNARISTESIIFNKLVGLVVVALNSTLFYLFDFQYKFYLQLLFTFIGFTGLLFQHKSNYIFVVEPSLIQSNEILPKNLVRNILFPFELIFENIITILESKNKKWSLSLNRKLTISPLIISLLTMVFYSKKFTFVNCVLAILISAILSTVLLLSYPKKPYLVNVYGLIVTSLLLSFVYGSTLGIASNLSSLIDLPRSSSIPFFLGPLVSIPSIMAQNYYIKSGFQHRTYFSIFYFVTFNLLISNLMQSYLLITGDYLSKLKSAYMGVLMLMVMTIGDVYRNRKRFTSICGYYGAYTIIQQILILLLLNE